MARQPMSMQDRLDGDSFLVGSSMGVEFLSDSVLVSGYAHFNGVSQGMRVGMCILYGLLSDCPFGEQHQGKTLS